MGMTDFTKLSDDDLIRRLKSDEFGAFKELYIRHWKALFSEAYKRLKNRELSEEAVQDLFANLWAKRHGLQINTTVGGYLFVSIGHYVIDHYRKEMIRMKYRADFKTGHSEADYSTENTIMLKDLTSTVESEISQLPDKCRSVYELSRNEHKTNKEIAQHLGISEKTVENHLTKALKRLRFSLSHYLSVFIFLLIK
jgi:RNA polymerase sigma-70 factor (family 1)